MGAQGIVETKYLSSTNSPSNHHGQGYEGNEGDEGHGCHEGHEGNEKEGSQQDRQGPIRQVCGFPWIQGEDRRWLDQNRFGAEQAWKDREQEAPCTWQEGIRQHQGLDSSSPEGKEGTQREGFRCCQEGFSSLQEGQGVLQLSISVWLLLRPWGYLHPSSAAACDCISIVEHLR